MIIISESHFTIHTWPEFGYAAVDVFTCGDVIDMDVAAETLRTGLEAASHAKDDAQPGHAGPAARSMILHKPHAQPLPRPMEET